MNFGNYQMNFDFSRNFDFQKNINSNFLDSVQNNLIGNDSLGRNAFFMKHMRFILTELFFCWLESSEKFLSVSMSKRGYKSASRYNPNKISSYCIKIIDYLKKNELIEFYPGFFDLKRKKSRLSRIKPGQKLIKEFKKIRLSFKHNINHEKREFIFLYQGNELQEYSDNLKTHEYREILRTYNKIIQKNFFDIPKYEKYFFKCSDGKILDLSIYSSVLNCFYPKNLYNEPLLGGCWWNRMDEGLILKYRENFIINNNRTSFIDILDFFPLFLNKLSDSNVDFFKSSFDDFSYNEKCYIFLKYAKSKNKEMFTRIFLREKLRYGFSNYSNKELKIMINNFINLNNNTFGILKKETSIKWLEFCSRIFLNLIKVSLNRDNPIYLVRDKIYFAFIHQRTIKHNLYKILEKEFETSEISIVINDCTKKIPNVKTFFSKFLNSEKEVSERYSQKLKKFERKEIYGS